LRKTSQQFLRSVHDALRDDGDLNVNSAGWTRVRELLEDLSRQRAAQGFSPRETATFVFCFKQALFNRLRAEYENDSTSLLKGVLQATELFDQLGLYTTEVHQRSREQVINRQQQEMLELSTPVIELWDGVLALPLIGTLDSQRTQVVMQNLLEAIVSQNSDLAIIDITGVPTVDTLVAQHLIKTVAAARLMGADCIISGIRPQIAQTIIHLGVDLGNVQTKATLAGAFQLALKKKGLGITRTA
jgi:rsbT co-antagonist protein RsbR